MSLLEQLVQPANDSVMATIVAEGGLGKTSLAALFPSPVFIRTEDGTKSLPNPPPCFPMATSGEMVIAQLNQLGIEDHDFKTVVVDSITKLNILIEQAIVESDPKANSINTALGGYGAGTSAASEAHREVKYYCDLLAQHKKMNVVFIAHSDVETIDQPDQDQYTRYTIRMNKRSVAHYSDDVDLVAYIKLNTLTRGGGDNKRAKATTDGSRIITCYPTPNHISKNRYGITQDILYTKGENPLIEYIPALQNK